MRLVKINDVILNMDHVAMIKSERRGEDYGGGVVVYAHTASQKVFLGICDNQEDYQKWVDAIYGEFSANFLGETISVDDEEEELWK